MLMVIRKRERGFSRTLKVYLSAGHRPNTMFNDEVMIAIRNIVPLIIILWSTIKQYYITRQDKAKKLALTKEGLIEETPEKLIKKYG